MAKELGITVKKEKDIAEWYPQVALKAELAEYSPVKGCMVIRPRGYAVWQAIMDYFNSRLKELNVQNAYFPLFIPESFFKKEQQHASGFQPEVAWIDKELTKGDERLAVRPTSETIMYDSYSRWIRSYRDLPLRINQWANVVRWETNAVKLFLRSREFLWQEGHCVYRTEKECEKETLMMLDEYKQMCEDLLALPVITGKKTPKETFAGAKYTTTIEALMPDGKALQCGTSHHLGQGFSKSFNITYLGEDEKQHNVWQNSWGFSTRLIGAMIMVHSDDKGLVLPPRVAPNKGVIVPIIFEDTKEKVLKKAKDIHDELKEFDVILDDRDEHKPGFKFNDHDLKGVPIKIEIGPKDLEKGHVVMSRRDIGKKEFVKFKDIKKTFAQMLDMMHKDMFKKAKKFLTDNVVEVDSFDKFENAIKQKKMVLAKWCGETICEDLIKDKTKGVSTRCIPFDKEKPKGKCIHCGKKAEHYVYLSRAY